MNTRKTLLVASAIVAAASILSAQAADKNLTVEQQLAEGDGYYSDYPGPSKKEPVKPETARQLQRDKDFARQLTEGDGPPYMQYTVQPTVKPETWREVQRDNELLRQMTEGDSGE